MPSGTQQEAREGGLSRKKVELQRILLVEQQNLKQQPSFKLLLPFSAGTYHAVTVVRHLVTSHRLFFTCANREFATKGTGHDKPLDNCLLVCGQCQELTPIHKSLGHELFIIKLGYLFLFTVVFLELLAALNLS